MEGSNSLNLDQDRHSVVPDVGPKCVDKVSDYKSCPYMERVKG